MSEEQEGLESDVEEILAPLEDIVESQWRLGNRDEDPEDSQKTLVLGEDVPDSQPQEEPEVNASESEDEHVVEPAVDGKEAKHCKLAEKHLEMKEFQMQLTYHPLIFTV